MLWIILFLLLVSCQCLVCSIWWPPYQLLSGWLSWLLWQPLSYGVSNRSNGINNRYYNIGDSVDWKSKQVNPKNCLWNAFPKGGFPTLVPYYYVVCLLSSRLDSARYVMPSPHLSPIIPLGRSAITRPRPPSSQLMWNIKIDHPSLERNLASSEICWRLRTTTMGQNHMACRMARHEVSQPLLWLSTC